MVDLSDFLHAPKRLKGLVQFIVQGGRAMNTVDKLKPFSLSVLPVSLLLLMAGPRRPIAGQSRIYG